MEPLSRSLALVNDVDERLEHEARELAARALAGSIRREALDILAGLEHRPSQRALRLLPLVLTPESGRAVEAERGAPANIEPWMRWGERLEPFGRALAVRAALSASELVRGAVADESGSTRAALVGLHTGPAGAIVMTEEQARSLAPLAAVTARARASTHAWLDAPSEAAAAAVDASWPELLRARLSAQLLAELADVDWRALWVVWKMVNAVTGPETHAGVAAGAAIAYAEDVTADRALVTSAVRSAVIGPLLGQD